MIKSGINSYIEHHKLTLKLKPILVGELYLARKLKHPVYVFKNGVMRPVMVQGSTPTKEQINVLIKNSFKEVFLYADDIKEIKSNLETALIKVTRSLSVGDPLENGTKDLKLLSLNMSGLYQNPHNDDLLMLQFQSTQNLGKFLIENKKFQSQFYQNLLKENFHFTLSQPMLSSLLLLSFLQSIHLFHDKEIENLFLASYLKDIGISMIPKEKYDQKTLNIRDKGLFADHADFSTDLLDGRIPLSKNYLTMIKNHHFLNDKMKELVTGERRRDPDVILGLESTLVAVFDILVAMTNDRPYRKAASLFQSLELIKKMMADDYPQEFKALVIFLKQFYKI
ncbi:MAG TPA: HD domain-containing phosphohydrolase [Bacteriovoracaceae bacterium]|nr:HD domain-containing phosphohydrolase [Bacteriovoracaceae bacterium]